MNHLLTKAVLLVAGFGLGTQIPHAPQGPTERDIIEILADYDVRHVPEIAGIPYYGATDMDRHIIYIVDNSDFIYKRRTVLHEFIHIMKRLRSEDDKDEDAINVIEEEEYKRLFVNQ